MYLKVNMSLHSLLGRYILDRPTQFVICLTHKDTFTAKGIYISLSCGSVYSLRSQPKEFTVVSFGA